MKKFVSVLLAIVMIFAFCVNAFAATEVTGTLADGTTISKPVSEVLKSADAGLAEVKESDSEKYEKLSAFFDEAKANPENLAIGFIDFDGFFADVTEANLDVTLPVEADAGKVVVVTTSDGSYGDYIAEQGTVVVPFPKDAKLLAYSIAGKETEDEWAWPVLPGEPTTITSSTVIVGSPSRTETSVYTTSPLPPVDKEEGIGSSAYEIHNMATDELEEIVPKEEADFVPVGEADKLDKDGTEKFLSEYENVKGISDKLVKYFFWLQIPDKYTVNEEHYLKLVFRCKGDNVQVTANGVPMTVVHESGITYYAKLTQLGAIAIMCNP